MDFGHLLIMISLITKTAGKPVFVQTGSSIQLDIREKLSEFISLVWSKDKTENVVRSNKINNTITAKIYKDTVEFNIETFSLTQSNMQKNDSGVYRATVLRDKEEIVAEYSVSVIDPVETPVLTFLEYMSDNSCTINVTCSGNDLTISSSYRSDNCSQEEVTSSSEIHTLALHCKEDVVVCNFSNPVSWKNDTIMIKQLCSTDENPKSPNPEKENSSFLSHQRLVLVIGLSVIVLFLAGSVVVYCFYKKCKKGAKQSNCTIYAEIEPNNEVQRAMEMSDRSERPHTVYSVESVNIQGHRRKKSKKEYHIYNEAPENIRAKTQRDNTYPQTTYCTVGQHQQPLVSAKNDHCIYSVVSKSPKRNTVV